MILRWYGDYKGESIIDRPNYLRLLLKTEIANEYRNDSNIDKIVKDVR